MSAAPPNQPFRIRSVLPLRADSRGNLVIGRVAVLTASNSPKQPLAKPLHGLARAIAAARRETATELGRVAALAARKPDFSALHGMERALAAHRFENSTNTKSHAR